MDYTEQAKQLVRLVRSYAATHDEAIGLIAQALRTAHSAGALEATRESGERMKETLDKIIVGPARLLRG